MPQSMSDLSVFAGMHEHERVPSKDEILRQLFGVEHTRNILRFIEGNLSFSIPFELFCLVFVMDNVVEFEFFFSKETMRARLFHRK